MTDSEDIAVASQELVISGLPIRVWNWPAPRSQAELGCLFLLHGRLCTSALVEPFAKRLVAAANSRSAEHSKSKHLIVVTFDHRNHGHRLASLPANHSWNTHPNMPGTPIENPAHAVDMYAIQTGTAQDVSMLVDFLPAYLFPEAQKTISDYGVIGISLGGHSTWLCAHDARIRFLVPIIGSPDYETLMRHRASKSRPEIPFEPPHFPKTLIDLVRQKDPCHADPKTWDQKHILVLSGASDKLVNFVDGGSAALVERLKSEKRLGSLEVVVEEGAGHELTEAMQDKTFEWVWNRIISIDGQQVQLKTNKLAAL